MSIKNYKIVRLGNTSVGKTSILSRAITNTFYEFQEPTIGAAFQVKTVDISKKNKKNNNIIKLEIWDTAGQERYRSLAPMYYRGAYVAVICYDVTCIDSFNGAKMWSKEIEEHASESCIRIFVGNKFDYVHEKKVFDDDEEWFETNNLINIKTSAKTNYNINELFELIAKKCNEVNNNKNFTISPNIIIKQKHNIKSKCC